jgi:hypothetical protein
MGIILYFAIGALNIVLLYLITHIYTRVSGVYLIPSGYMSDTILTLIAFLLSGYFGTIVLGVLGLHLFVLWVKYYRKK